jgi:hypothetical protein
VVLHLFRQLDARVLTELGAAPASAVVEEAHEGVSQIVREFVCGVWQKRAEEVREPLHERLVHDVVAALEVVEVKQGKRVGVDGLPQHALQARLDEVIVRVA